MESYFILTNPKAGKGSAPIKAESLKELLAAEGKKAEIYFTEADSAKGILGPFHEREHSDLVVIGGDGTLNHAVNALRKPDVTLSIIPAGTGNDFVKNIDIGTSFERQAACVLSGKSQSIDLGLCNGKKFLNGVGVGFDGQIVRDMLFKRTLLSGHAAYYYHVLRILSSYKERTFSLNVEGEISKEELILLTIGNGTTFGGGFKLTPNASIIDGFLDVCFIGKLSPIKRFLNIQKLSNGSHLSLKAIREQKVKRVSIEENPLLEAHIDGEYLGGGPFDIEIVPRALKVKTGL